jgi:hypothetical protein
MKKQKPQIFFIHGGMTFKCRKDYVNWLKKREISLEKKTKWSYGYFDRALGKKFQIIKPRMPQQDDAKYEDWKISFERYFPYLKHNIILIGSSLGGIFLSKYLSENKFPKKILSVYLVGAPFDDELSNEDLAGGFKLKSNLSMIEENCGRVNLLFSKNDDVVPVKQAEKYRKKLKNANIVIYKNKNRHFIVSKFPEIIRMIKKDAKNM